MYTRNYFFSFQIHGVPKNFSQKDVDKMSIFLSMVKTEMTSQTALCLGETKDGPWTMFFRTTLEDSR